MKVEIRNNEAIIEGYVNVVERESRMLHDTQGNFIEVVRAGTFEKALGRGDNVNFKYNHKQILGDTVHKDIELREDNIGLYAKSRVTDPVIIEKAEKKELRGWSFGFVCLDNKWDVPNDGIRRRYLTDMELREVSILDKTPAYIATSIELRDNEEQLIEFRSAEEEIEIVESREKAKEEPSFFNEDKELELIKIRGGMYK